MWIFTIWPFTLDGPRFLLFYAGLGGVVWIVLGWALARIGGSGSGAAPVLQTLAQDPYRIACLRGGPAEAVRVAVTSLVDRGMLEVGDSEGLTTTRRGRVERGGSPLDQALLEACADGDRQPHTLLGDAAVQRTTRPLEDELARQGLVASAAGMARRERVRAGAWLALLALTVLRVAQTLMAGHSNLVFLALLTVVVLIGVSIIGRGRLTPEGRRALASLKTLMGDLQRRAGGLKPGSSNRDMTLLAAMFGLAALPAGYAFAEQLFPRSSGSSSDSGASGFSNSGGGGDGGGGGGDSGCGGGGCGGGGSSD